MVLRRRPYRTHYLPCCPAPGSEHEKPSHRTSAANPVRTHYYIGRQSGCPLEATTTSIPPPNLDPRGPSSPRAGQKPVASPRLSCPDRGPVPSVKARPGPSQLSQPISWPVTIFFLSSFLLSLPRLGGGETGLHGIHYHYATPCALTYLIPVLGAGTPTPKYSVHIL